ARPPGCRYALNGNEDDAGVRQHGEEQPVRVECTPGAIRTDDGADNEDDRADDCENEKRRLERRGNGLARREQYFIPGRDARGMEAHGRFLCVVESAVRTGRALSRAEVGDAAAALGTAEGAPAAAGCVPGCGYTMWKYGAGRVGAET